MQETHNLILDLGNSSSKIYWADSEYFNLSEFAALVDIGEEFKILVISSQDQEKTASFLEELVNTINKKGSTVVSQEIFDAEKQDSIKNLYSGIGADRVAKLIGAQKLYPGRNIVLMDFGTATTINVLDAEGYFIYGYISLGFRAALNALSEKCAALADYSGFELKQMLMEKDYHSPSHQAILEGSFRAHQALVRSWLEDACSEFAGDCMMLATGGDAALFAEFFDLKVESRELLASL